MAARGHIQGQAANAQVPLIDSLKLKYPQEWEEVVGGTPEQETTSVGSLMGRAMVDLNPEDSKLQWRAH